MAAKRRITVKLAGREYPMTVGSQDEEEKFRRAARDLNGLIAAYQTRFAAEPEDYLAMAALQVAADKVGMEMDRAKDLEHEEMRCIGALIDDYFATVKG